MTLQLLLDEHSQFRFCKENGSAGRRMRGVDGTLMSILRCDQRSIACSKYLGDPTEHTWQLVLLDGLLLFETIVTMSRLLPRQECSLSWKQVPVWFESAASVAHVSTLRVPARETAALLLQLAGHQCHLTSHLWIRLRSGVVTYVPYQNYPTTGEKKLQWLMLTKL